MEYFTADTYAGWERVGKPFEKNGKLYTTVKEVCPRCSGRGIVIARVENGRPIPVQPDNGICYACGGDKYLTKEVRLYTQKEKEQMDKRNEKAREKKEAEREARIKAEYAQKKAQWLQSNGFNAEGETYIVTGDSFSIKDELKEAGFRFSGALKRWMRGTNDGYEDKTEKFTTDQLVDFTAWGIGEYKTNAKALVDETAGDREKKEYEFGEPIKTKIEDKKVVVKDIFSFSSFYGRTNVYKFECEKIIYVWMTSTFHSIKVGDTILLTGTIKDHTTYKGEHQTNITRCKIKKWEEQ